MQGIAKSLREGGLLVGSKKACNRELPPARDKKQPLNAEFLVRDLFESHPQRIEPPLARLAAVADLAHGERRRRDGDLLVGERAAVVDAERPVEQQHVETE